MARLASACLLPSRDADLLDIEDWYREFLAGTLPPAELEWDPVRIGPTWQYDGGWVLPEASLGWGVLAWCGLWLTGRGGKPWRFTAEQARFLLWYYAVDSVGDFVYHSAMLQRLKGWGKDPLAAAVAAASLHAPVVFDCWDGDRPVGRDEPDAWTQIVAVSQEQTKNTMKLFPGLISPEAQRQYGIQIGRLNVWSDGDRRQIEAVTSSPAAIEGGRPKQIIRNELQNWDSSNGGHDMAGAIEGNAAKAEVGSPARILDIFNAYRPGRGSVAERAREAWESTQGEDATQADYGVLLDSLEAPPNAPLTAADAPAVVRSIAGDATWLDTRPNGRIVKSILNPDNSPSESRRKWYNQITGVEDAWAQPQWVDANINRKILLEPGDRVFLFGDGSKSGDDTGLVACRLSDGFLQTLHHQHPEPGQTVNRDLLDVAVEDAVGAYRVLGLFFDPSHAKTDDQTDDDRFWWPLVDEWHQRYAKRLKLWAVKTGPRQHAVAFDMLKPGMQQRFQPLVAQTAEEMKAGTCPHHGGTVLRAHMKNARIRDGAYGSTVGKEHRSSKLKIDLAVCAIGARMMRREYLLAKKDAGDGAPGKGRVLVLK
jgi:hypothetical protein